MLPEPTVLLGPVLIPAPVLSKVMFKPVILVSEVNKGVPPLFKVLDSWLFKKMLP